MSFLSNMFSSPSAPAAPNVSALAGAQAGANEQTAKMNARLNRVDQLTPTGTIKYDRLGGNRWQVRQKLRPDMQKMFDQQVDIGQGVNRQAKRALRQLPNKKFSLSGVPAFQDEIDYSGLMELPQETDLASYAQRAEDAAYSRVMDRLNPEFERGRESMEARLANQGITMGSEAYNTEMERFGNQMNDARTRAAYDAIGEGSALRSSLLADALTGRQQGLSERVTDLNLANQGRSTAINDMLLERTQPLNELAALLQGQQAVPMPQAQPVAQVGMAAPDIMGASAMAQNAQNARYQGQMASQNAGLGGLFGLGGAAISGGLFGG